MDYLIIIILDHLTTVYTGSSPSNWDFAECNLSGIIFGKDRV